ncbi:MAG: MipA/OmpV family protein [Nevskiaceae bacterium]|nr:MAG: MipA/OmpV family protein [Nevskiaceae bacterium]
MQLRRPAWALIAVIATLLRPGVLHAEDALALPEWVLSAGIPLLYHDGEPAPAWSVTALAAMETLPRYAGDDVLRTRAFPLLDVRYKDLAFASAIEGLGVNLLHGRTCRAGVTLNFDPGRSPADAPRLRGTRRLPPSPDARAFVDYVIFPAVFRAELRHTLAGAPGWVMDAAAYAPVLATEQLTAFVGLSATVADHTWMNARFGLTPSQAAAAGLPAYEAPAGLRSAALAADLAWTPRGPWLLNLTVSAQRLGAAAGDSPLTVTRIEPALSLSLGYTF